MIRQLLLLLILLSNFNFSFAQEENTRKDIDTDQFIHRSTFLSAIIPSAGQIHNNKIKPDDVHSRLWWKLPIIYGGISAAGYLFIYNLNEYSLIKKERLSRQDGNFPVYYPSYEADDLTVIQDIFRKRRDLSFIAFIGIYALQLIDANVEAHLFLFDSDDDLSFKIDAHPLLGNSKRFTPTLSVRYRFNKEKTLNKSFSN
jgi:hypothetical protein